MPAMAELRARLAELADLSALGGLAGWDQRVMMPPEGATARANQLATLDRVSHELASAEEIGEWLEELEGSELDEIDRDIVRVARRDFERQRSVPADLVGERAQAAAAGQAAWQTARANADFAAFAPALARNVELARAYAACFKDAARPYDALLYDFDYGVATERVEATFARLADGLRPLIADVGRQPERHAVPVGIPIEAQRAAVGATLRRLGVSEDTDLMELDPSDPESAGKAAYAWLTYLQGELVETLLGDLPG